MQINNSTTNFGSIHLSPKIKTKPVSELTDVLKQYASGVKFMNYGNKISEMQAIQKTRNTINKNSSLGVLFHNNKAIVVGHDQPEEAFYHRLITKKLDPEAKLVDDAPHIDPNAPSFELLG